MTTILTISGSSREASFNTRLLKTFPSLAPDTVTFEHLDWSDIPLYNQDLESEFPEAVTRAKEKIMAADGVIISTPEYNRSIPGPLKNLIDWTSRPYAQGAWVGKPTHVIGASMAPTGTALAQADLRKSLLFMDARVPGQPEFYLGNAHEVFDESGTLTDDATKDRIRKAIDSFVAFIGK